jgi:hypothetical protein
MLDDGEGDTKSGVGQKRQHARASGFIRVRWHRLQTRNPSVIFHVIRAGEFRDPTAGMSCSQTDMDLNNNIVLAVSDNAY